MKNVSMLFILLIVLVSCKTLPYPPPQVELCGHSEYYEFALCSDYRKEEGNQTYNREYAPTDLCTNSTDFEALEDYVIELRTKLKKYIIKYGEL